MWIKQNVILEKDIVTVQFYYIFIIFIIAHLTFFIDKRDFRISRVIA